MFKDLSRGPVRNKGYTNLNKEQFMGNNSTVDEAESQINDLEHKEAKTTNQNNKKKKELKKMRVV